MYSLDTSFLLDWWVRRFPPDIFPSMRAKMETLADENQLWLVDLVRDELAATAPPELLDWVKARRQMIVSITEEIQQEAMRIQAAFPGLLDPRATYEEADPYIIALASLKKWIVVTSETPASTKPRARRSHYIPDVFAALEIECLDLFSFIRRQGWSF